MIAPGPDLFDRIAAALVEAKKRATATGKTMYAADVAAVIREGFPDLKECPAKADSGQSYAPSVDSATPEAIYDAYPRHVGRKAALRAIQTALKGLKGKVEADPKEYLLDRVKAYAAAVSEWPASDRQFVPHPATWINQGRWADAPSEWKRQGKAAPAQARDYSRLS